jgi:hypothetical protein
VRVRSPDGAHFDASLNLSTSGAGGLLLTLPLCAVLASSPQPGIALGTCGLTEKPNGIGTCQLCSALITSANIASASLGVVFGIAAIQNANYTISNNVGTFNASASVLASTTL